MGSVRPNCKVYTCDPLHRDVLQRSLLLLALFDEDRDPVNIEKSLISPCDKIQHYSPAVTCIHILYISLHFLYKFREFSWPSNHSVGDLVSLAPDCTI